VSASINIDILCLAESPANCLLVAHAMKNATHKRDATNGNNLSLCIILQMYHDPYQKQYSSKSRRGQKMFNHKWIYAPDEYSNNYKAREWLIFIQINHPKQRI